MLTSKNKSVIEYVRKSVTVPIGVETNLDLPNAIPRPRQIPGLLGYPKVNDDIIVKPSYLLVNTTNGILHKVANIQAEQLFVTEIEGYDPEHIAGLLITGRVEPYVINGVISANGICLVTVESMGLFRKVFHSGSMFLNIYDMSRKCCDEPPPKEPVGPALIEKHLKKLRESVR